MKIFCRIYETFSSLENKSDFFKNIRHLIEILHRLCNMFDCREV